MTYWEDIVITVGGWDDSSNLKEVHQFMTRKNEWQALPSFPHKISSSSATVLTNVLYNFGGDGSPNSVGWLDLRNVKGKWSSLKTLG